MALCKDPALTYLNKLGYNVVRLPRTGIVPLDVLGVYRGSPPESLGTIKTIWDATNPPAPVEEEAAEIRGQTTSSLKLSVGVKLLEGFLGALGASTPSIRTSYQNAKAVKFRFASPRILKIDPFKVGDYLRTGDLTTDNPVVTKYFFENRYSALIITEVLQSKSISVTAEDNNGSDVEIDVPAITNAVGADLKIAATNGTQGDLTYEGKAYLTFGFKAYQLAFINGRWDIDRSVVDDDKAMLSANPDEADDDIISPVVLGGGLSDFLIQ